MAHSELGQTSPVGGLGVAEWIGHGGLGVHGLKFQHEWTTLLQGRLSKHSKRFDIKPC